MKRDCQKEDPKILLVTNYWRPWNTSGTFRWLHLSRWMDFKVLTSKRPKKGFEDETTPDYGKPVIRFPLCYRLPAILSGFILSIVSCFVRADIYIYTCPPEALLFGAWINQRLGRKVVIDLRDKIDRRDQPLNFMVNIYRWVYSKFWNTVTTMQHFDPNAYCIPAGYAMNWKSNRYHGRFIDCTVRYNYHQYKLMLEHGMGIDFTKNLVGHYTSSAVAELLHLGNTIKGSDKLHSDLFRSLPDSYQELAEQYKEHLEYV